MGTTVVYTAAALAGLAVPWVIGMLVSEVRIKGFLWLSWVWGAGRGEALTYASATAADKTESLSGGGSHWRPIGCLLPSIVAELQI